MTGSGRTGQAKDNGQDVTERRADGNGEKVMTDVASMAVKN